MLAINKEAFRNDLILQEARINKMISRKLIKRCRDCMKSLEYEDMCSACRR